jgi:hypothetical protein
VKNNWNKEIVPYFGSTWCALPRETVKYIIDFVEKNPWFNETTKLTFAPDEYFFHTIIGNSIFNEYSDGIVPFKDGGYTNMQTFIF